MMPRRTRLHVPDLLRHLIPARPATRDALLIVLTTLAVGALLIATNAGNPLHNFLENNEEWQIDEILLTGVFALGGLIVFSFRRLRELKSESEARGAAQAEAHMLARHDPLTGLPNRRCFSEKLEHCLEMTADEGTRLAVLMLDLDGFKQINDLHGHAMGDRALIASADRIASAAWNGEALLARIGGDEFALIMPKINSLEEPTRLARRILAAFVEPFMIDSTAVTLGCGIGIAIAPDDGIQSDELLRRADRALYRAKSERPSSIRHFEPGMDEHLERRALLEKEMRKAIVGEGIVPYYQPIVSFEGDRIIGFEALARWQHPELGTIPPNEFIPIAEESGMIGGLSDLLLRRACKDARKWPKDMTLSFNLSPVQLRDTTLGLRILAALGETGFDPYRLELEITESALVDHGGVAQSVINNLRDAGVRIALDDFGTGYATLSQLLALHVDKLKIDRSFVDRLGKDNESTIIIRAIIGLANGFGLTTTAEGIEDAGQLNYLKENGCTEGQGYLFSKAVPAAEVPLLLRQTSPRIDPRVSA